MDEVAPNIAAAAPTLQSVPLQVLVANGAMTSGQAM